MAVKYVLSSFIFKGGYMIYQENKFIEYCKNHCKFIKKYINPENLTLMQIQHKYAKMLGFQSWNEFINLIKEK